MKKLISALLAVAIIISTNVCFAAIKNENDIMDLLSELEIMSGDPDGNLRLDDYVTRAEFAKVAVASSTYKNAVATALKVSPFSDVTYRHWAAPYVKTAVTNKICEGYTDSTFRPDNYVTFEEAVTMMLRVLGYTDEDFGISWPYGQIGMADSLDMTKNVNANIGDSLTRGQVAMLIFNTLDTKMKSTATTQSVKLISIFDCSLIENVTLIATKNENSGMASGKISTTSGTYDLNNEFDYNYVGRKGDLYIKNGDDIISFIPEDQIVEKYSVTDKIGSDLILDDKILDIDDNLTVYYKSTTSTYSGIIDSANKGDEFRIFYNNFGVVQYAMLIPKSSGSVSTLNSLEKYTVYQILDNSVVVYENDQRLQLDITDSTTAYNDNIKTTYGNLKAMLEKGDTIYIKRDTNGAISYVTLKNTSTQNAVTVSMEKHIVYSLVGNQIATYCNGVQSSLSVNNETTVYDDSVKYTYSSIKSKLEMGDLLYIKRNEDSTIDYISYEKGNVIGPKTVVGSSWLASLTSDTNGVSIMRDGAKVTSADIKTNDVVYYLGDLNIILAYSTKITGIYEKALPNKDIPTSITISGTSYDIESVEAFNKLSSTGDFSYGDTITVLLGKNNEVADVITPEIAAESGDVVGYVTGYGTKQITKPDTTTYTGYYIKLALTDGKEYEYIANKNYETSLSSIVKLSFTNGVAKTSDISSSTVSGIFDWNRRSLGAYKLSSNIKIIDVATTESLKKASYAAIFPQRLDGLNLKDKILYLNKNASNEITELILSDVTGDAYTYALVTETKKTGNSSLTSSFSYDINGSVNSYMGTTSFSGLSTGTPVSILYSKSGSVDFAKPLTKVSGTVSSVDSTTLKTSSESFNVSDKLIVYKRDSNYDFTISQINDIDTKAYTINAYYDKSTASGGQIRIIVAIPK